MQRFDQRRFYIQYQLLVCLLLHYSYFWAFIIRQSNAYANPIPVSLVLLSLITIINTQDKGGGGRGGICFRTSCEIFTPPPKGNPEYAPRGVIISSLGHYARSWTWTRRPRIWPGNLILTPVKFTPWRGTNCTGSPVLSTTRAESKKIKKKGYI